MGIITPPKSERSNWRRAALAQVQDLLLLVTSMGGARPKAVVEDEGQLRVAKFNRTD